MCRRLNGFALAQPAPPQVIDQDSAGGRAPAIPASVPPPARRVVNNNGKISLARHQYAVGTWLAGETVDVRPAG
jgi:hypothetical protein